MSHPILKLWNDLKKLPGGKILFQWALNFKIPYSGSIGARVRTLEPGYAVVTMADRRKVRNHLNSIHAVAQLNIGELCSGLAMTSRLTNNIRGIVTGLEIEYTKKARGTLTAESRCETLDITEKTEITVECFLRDEKGDQVSKTKAFWLVEPKT